MINITYMYFYYTQNGDIMQVERREFMIIGICGKSGSGKSTIARAITDTNPKAIHCDIDKIGHQTLEIKEVQEEAIKCFGQRIMVDGKINRKRLGELVFSSRERMKQLSDITWKYMQVTIDYLIRKNEDNIIILDWILLSNTRYFDMCDMKVLVDVPYEVRMRRTLERDGITSEEFALRERASIEYDHNRFDMVVSNDDVNEIRKLVKKYDKSLISR